MNIISSVTNRKFSVIKITMVSHKDTRITIGSPHNNTNILVGVYYVVGQFNYWVFYEYFLCIHNGFCPVDVDITFYHKILR